MLDGLFSGGLGADEKETAGPERPEGTRPPAGLAPRALRLWHVERRIDSLTGALAQAEAEGNLARIAGLSGQLRSWLDALAELAPPEPPAKEDEEARWKVAAASAIAKIERGVREVEGSAACRKCGAACAACNASPQGVTSGA